MFLCGHGATRLFSYSVVSEGCAIKNRLAFRCPVFRVRAISRVADITTDIEDVAPTVIAATRLIIKS